MESNNQGYSYDWAWRREMRKVAIIGSGPAGLFCADRLAKHVDVTIYETGEIISHRICPATGCKDCKICHVLEGEGGAGGFSDGKNTYSLMRGTQMESIFPSDADKWLGYIDGLTVKFAGDGVWYDPLDEPPKEFAKSPLWFDSYPLRHVGSDGIRRFVQGLSSDLTFRGVEVLCRQRAEPATRKIWPYSDRWIADGVFVDRGYGDDLHDYDVVVLAMGLQGIPWIEKYMKDHNSPLTEGPAGFGIRLETASGVLAPLHEKFYDYKITLDLDGLSVRSFCCNHQGLVLNERHTDLGIVNVNGHSFLDPQKRTQSSNLAIMIKVTEPNIQSIVRDVSRGICDKAGGSAYQPVMNFLDLQSMSDNRYMTNMQSHYIDIKAMLPAHFYHAFCEFIMELNHIVPIVSPISVIYAPEMKYYGRRANVALNWKSNDIENLYVIGSGSGHLDSFVAAALSGIIAAENIKEEVS